MSVTVYFFIFILWTHTTHSHLTRWARDSQTAMVASSSLGASETKKRLLLKFLQQKLSPMKNVSKSSDFLF